MSVINFFLGHGCSIKAQAEPCSNTGAVYKAISHQTSFSFIKHALINHTALLQRQIVRPFFVHGMKGVKRKRREEKEEEAIREGERERENKMVRTRPKRV